MEQIMKEMSVFVKQGTYGYVMSYTNGKEWFDVKFNRNSTLKVNKTGYWRILVDALQMKKPQDKQTKENGFVTNRTIWLNDECVISMEYDEEKNNASAKKRLDDILDLF